MSRKVPNAARDADVRLPPARQTPRTAPTRAADLTEGQVWVLVELALRHGGHPADRCYTLYGFHPTTEDVTEIDWRVRTYRPGWQKWIDVITNERKAA